MTLQLFCVESGIRTATNSDDLDLYVIANHRAEAVKLWVSYHCLGADDMPDRVWLIPVKIEGEAIPRALGWNWGGVSEV